MRKQRSRRRSLNTHLPNFDHAERKTERNMKIASIILKGLFLFSCAYGLSLSVLDSPSFPIFISYYTTQSNLLCLGVMFVFFVWEFIGQGKNPRFLRVLKSLATVSILVTFIIYHFLLRPNMEPNMTNVSHGLSNILVHYVTPLWFLSDYLLFDVKGTSRLTDPLLYTIFPLYYFVFSNLRAVEGELYRYGSTISQFPYPFLDYEVFGIYGVSFAIIILTSAVLVLGIVFVAFDQVMKKPKVRYRTHLYGAISKKPVPKRINLFSKSKTGLVRAKVDENEAEHTKDSLIYLEVRDADRYS
jgi:hypothetical protein